MLFNSTAFLQFFAAFLLLYFLCRDSLRARNLLVIAGSWLFYGWWDYRFLSLLLFSGCFDFAIGRWLEIAREPGKRKAILGLSVVVNLSLLGFFKYFDFFASSLATVLATLHWPVPIRTLGILLPVGISFYTFQSLSYVIDIYRGQLRPTQSLVTYLAFVSFFPQLVAGPIQRGRHLLPQFERTAVITGDLLAEGLWLVLWGLFKKVAMADQLAPMVAMVFDHPSPGGPAVVAGAVAFAFQIYGDFSGYSDIARGLAKFLGFDLTENFLRPYFAQDLREFWRRWHISLSTWLRDYLYISLGGSRQRPARTAGNVMVTMLLGGLWHGASWNFVLWGAWHGLGVLIVQGWHSWQRRGRGTVLPWWLAMPLTCCFVGYGWLLFRASSLEQVSRLTGALASLASPTWLLDYLISLLVLVVPLLAVEVWQERVQQHPLAMPGWLRHSLQAVLLLSLILFWEKHSIPFIYFQF